MTLLTPSRRRAGLALLAVAITACSVASPVPATRPSAEPSPVAVPDPLKGPWEIHGRAGVVRHEVSFVAELVSRIDTVERRDSLRAVTTLEWSRVSGGIAERVGGLITEFRASVDSAAPATPHGLLLPIPFSATLGAGGSAPHVERPDPGGCGPDAAAASAAREVLLAMPRRVDLGTSWADSARFTVCRDSVPLQVQTTRTFRVTGADRRDGEVVLVVDRTTRVTMRGDGRQFGEPIAVEAEGSGEMRFAVRVTDAVVTEGEGSHELRMTMRGSRRSQQLTQYTRVSVRTP